MGIYSYKTNCVHLRKNGIHSWYNYPILNVSRDELLLEIWPLNGRNQNSNFLLFNWHNQDLNPLGSTWNRYHWLHYVLYLQFCMGKSQIFITRICLPCFPLFFLIFLHRLFTPRKVISSKFMMPNSVLVLDRYQKVRLECLLYMKIVL